MRDTKLTLSVRILGPASVSPPKISVIVPTYNRPVWLRAAVGSVVAQEMADSVEIIVINDGKHIDPLSLEFAAASHRIIVIDPVNPLGPSRARNLGIEHSTGACVAFLDDDDIFLKGHLKTALNCMGDSGCSFVYMGGLVSEYRLNPDSGENSANAYKTYKHDSRLLSIANYIHTSSVVVKNFRETPVRFDPELTVCEDWDLWIALTTKLGFRAMYGGSITSIYHQIPGEQGMVADAQTRSPSDFTLARQYIYEKWPDSSPLVNAFRAWMLRFEDIRDELIEEGKTMPNLLFDSVLSYLNKNLAARQLPRETDIANFFNSEN